MFTFVSDLWSGRASDKLLVHFYNFLSKAGDNVMADCDFETEEQLVERKVTLNILPCLGRQGQQFPVGEVDETQKCFSQKSCRVSHWAYEKAWSGDFPITLAPIASHIFKVYDPYTGTTHY